MKSDARFHMRLPSKLKEDAERQARKSGVSLAEIVKALLHRWLSGFKGKDKA